MTHTILTGPGAGGERDVALRVRRADWPRDEAAIAAVRRAVFIQEQGVPEALEWEPDDPRCDWFLAEAADQVVGTARLTADARIGRMAVLPQWRRRGVGSALMRAVLAHARTLGLQQVSLHAQVHALPFYARFGFQPVGPQFDEAGIPHRRMFLRLACQEG
ncbi:MAG: GNAT family N-acetyltransferase [Thiobacillaceae bacterium]|nr:GNAT family N-acetyltransferase [Thiobacillaceae bacterium]MDW8324182.1 GNAT family N-acetyltransferase [Burkholderiales bacterium]